MTGRPECFHLAMTREELIDEAVRGTVYRFGGDLELMQKHGPADLFVKQVRNLFHRMHTEPTSFGPSYILKDSLQ